MEGNAYTADKPHVATNMYAARDQFAASELAKDAFGEEVVDHYLNRARIELDALERTVTDWERFRGFERL
jgi:glutamine synthetase